MSGSGSDQMPLKANRKTIPTLLESLLVAISEVINSVVSIEIEHENFIAVGCYLYRTSAVIKEVEIDKSTSTETIENLECLSKTIDLARTLTKRYQMCAYSIQLSELENSMEQFENIIRNIGKYLGLLPSALYGNQEFAKRAAKSLSDEMRSAQFVVSHTSSIEQKEQKVHISSPVKQSKEKSVEIERDLYSIDIEDSMEKLQLPDTLNLLHTKSIRDTDHVDVKNHESSPSVSLMTLPTLAQFMEPLYETFFCPLTKKIMDDPVTIPSGITCQAWISIIVARAFDIPPSL